MEPIYEFDYQERAPEEHDVGMAYQGGGQSICPQCGNSEQVRTVRELFDMLNGMHEQTMQRASQFGQPGYGPGYGSDDDDYDHYNVEGSDARPGMGSWTGRRPRRGLDFDFDSSGNIAEDIAGAAAGAAIAGALGFAGRALGRRMKKAFDERVVPAMQAKAAQAQQQWEQSKADQEAIAQRYPELRGCMRDNVVFLDGGTRTVPIKDIKMPITADQADAVVARLR